MKFVISYSGGKDSALALQQMLADGHTPVGLLVMVNKTQGRSWFHGISFSLWQEISRSMNIPLLLCESAGEDYNAVFEDGLRRAQQLGAEACVFGDIDIEDHLDWCRQRCQAVGIQCLHPLWHRDRAENTAEALQLGMQCVLKCVRTSVLPASYLGKVLDEALLEDFAQRGIDVCGENGEYHTVVLDGPMFSFPVAWRCGEIVEDGQTAAIELLPQEKDHYDA